MVEELQLLRVAAPEGKTSEKLWFSNITRKT